MTVGHIKESVYQHLPVIGQDLACSLEGLRVRRVRFGGTFQTQLATAVERGNWDAERMIELRDQRLSAFVRHAATTVPYYTRLFRQVGLTPSDIRSLDDLRVLPLLKKEMLQDSPDDFRSTSNSLGKVLLAHTSGTTGGGLHFTTTVPGMREQWATWWRYRLWHGIRIGTWCGYFGGRSQVPVVQSKPPFWRTNHPGRQILFSGYHMNDRNLSQYISELRRRRPPWLHGYPSLLAVLAAYVLDHEGGDLGYELKWVTVGAENLLDHQYDSIFRAFGVAPRQHYGMAEAVANASECEFGNLHVDEDFAALEVIPTDMGTELIVGTNFTNLASPFLRYEVGDTARLRELPCPCRRPGRILDGLDGRKEDYVTCPDGTKLGRLDHIFKDMIRVREAQIYQPDLRRLIVRIVPSRGYGPADETKLRYEIGKRIPQGFETEITYVETISKSSTGKLRFVISDV